MSTRTRRPFDATWLPFGVLIGTMVGIGLGIEMFGNVWAGGAVGVGLGLVIGVVLGLRGKRGPSAPRGTTRSPRRPDAPLPRGARVHERAGSSLPNGLSSTYQVSCPILGDTDAMLWRPSHEEVVNGTMQDFPRRTP